MGSPETLAVATIALIVLATAPRTGDASPAGLDDALNAGDLVCDFRADYARALAAEPDRGSPAADLMLLYEAIDAKRGHAHVVSTQSVGRKSVTLRATPSALHLIEELHASVKVTTLTGCLDWRVKHGVQACVRFAARHAWHFDTDVRTNPDASFARHQRDAIAGQCEPWTLD